MKIYGIVGTFFQANKHMEVVNASETEGGTHVELREAAMSHVFSGHYAIDENGDSLGNMLDEFGPSVITIAKQDFDELVFYKTYPGRTSITYELKRTGDTWTGTYNSPEVGRGKVRCKLIELKEEMFNLNPRKTETQHHSG